MYEALRTRLASLLNRARPLKPQTERQLTQRLSEYSSDRRSFSLCAAQVLEEYELEIVFGPHFTPTIDERAELADLLFHWRPTEAQVQRVVGDLCKDVPTVPVKLPDSTEAQLTTHEVMIERFVQLLRLTSAPDPATATALREVMPAELWPIGIALLCERGMTPDHQLYLVALLNHLRTLKTPITRGLLESTTEFLAGQKSLDHDTLLAAGEALRRATEGTAAFTRAGHTYWSADVAQHHHYRGQGNVDQERLAQRQAELQHITELVDALRTFEFHDHV